METFCLVKLIILAFMKVGLFYDVLYNYDEKTGLGSLLTLFKESK